MVIIKCREEGVTVIIVSGLIKIAVGFKVIINAVMVMEGNINGRTEDYMNQDKDKIDKPMIDH